MVSFYFKESGQVFFVILQCKEIDKKYETKFKGSLCWQRMAPFVFARRSTCIESTMVSSSLS